MTTCIVAFQRDSRKDEERLRLLHVVETLCYQQKRRLVDLRFDIIVQNPASEAQSIMILHRGSVPGRLDNHFTLAEAGVPMEFAVKSSSVTQLLLELYAHNPTRLAWNKEGFIEFHPRWNCVGCSPEIVKIQPLLNLNIEMLDENPILPIRPFSRFVIGPFPPRVSTCFSLCLSVVGATYDHLVGTNASFSIDGATRLLEIIKSKDLPEYCRDSASNEDPPNSESIIYPHAYDVVIPKDKTVCDKLSISAPSAQAVCFLRKADVRRNIAHWYATQSPDFYLELSYADEEAKVAFSQAG